MQIGFVFTDRAPLDPVHAEWQRNQSAELHSRLPAVPLLTPPVPQLTPNPIYSIFSDLQRSADKMFYINFQECRRIQKPQHTFPFPFALPTPTPLTSSPPCFYPSPSSLSHLYQLSNNYDKFISSHFRSFVSFVFSCIPFVFRFKQNYCKWRALAPHPIPSHHHPHPIFAQFQLQLSERCKFEALLMWQTSARLRVVSCKSYG